MATFQLFFQSGRAKIYQHPRNLKFTQVKSTTMILNLKWLVFHTVIWEKEVGSEEVKGVGAPGEREETRIRNIQPLTAALAGTYFGGHN